MKISINRLFRKHSQHTPGEQDTPLQPLEQIAAAKRCRDFNRECFDQEHLWHI